MCGHQHARLPERHARVSSLAVSPCIYTSSSAPFAPCRPLLQLMEGPAADGLLARLQPSLVGRGALLNVGEMHLTLPPDAAAILLPGNDAAAATRGLLGAGAVGAAARQLGGGAAGGGSGAPAGPTPPPRQQRMTGGGSGSGRVVHDSDDW